jgi:regulation of enolase protein 1 (concanavalin A-like superfamily)
MHVPGTPHVLSAEVPELPMNAPRVMRAIRGDFTASVRVLGRLDPGRLRTTHYDPYHGAGLIVWQDPSNYLRLERAVGFMNGKRHPYINFEVRERGRLAESHGIPIADRPIFLKLSRQGVEFSAWYSDDRSQWVGLGTVRASFIERIEVGVVAVNSARRALSAELQWLSFEDPRGAMVSDALDLDRK